MERRRSLRPWSRWTYPVALRLLNVDKVFSAGEAREKPDRIIDRWFKQLQGKINRKPRYNRNQAHNRFLTDIKKKAQAGRDPRGQAHSTQQDQEKPACDRWHDQLRRNAFGAQPPAVLQACLSLVKHTGSTRRGMTRTAG